MSKFLSFLFLFLCYNNIRVIILKKYIVLGVLLILLGLTYSYQEEIVLFVTEHFLSRGETETKLVENSYFLSGNYKFVQVTNQFSPKNKQDIRNIFYTVIDSGSREFTFYCPREYQNCIEDVKYISGDQKLLSDINNYVHAFNSFRHLETEYDNLGKVTLRIVHTYTTEEIEAINQKMDAIEAEVLTPNMTTEQKIKAIHDYIIKHTKYDSARSDKKVNQYQSDTAYGALLQGYAICGGYADSMKLFLDRYKIPNYKIASENHVWNLVLINQQWLHLDLTWDDPVIEGGGDTLEYNYFLITSEELQKLEMEQHFFDVTSYPEANTAKEN